MRVRDGRFGHGTAIAAFGVTLDPGAPAVKSQVLIVEDHPTYTHLLTAAAQARGFQVLEPVADPAGAIEACKRYRPEVIVLDLHLSGEVDGIALCDLILDLDGTTRIVAAGSFPESGQVDRAFRHGVHRCLRKPFRMDEALRLFENLAKEFEGALT